MDWAKYIVAFEALKGMPTVLLANLIFQARYFTNMVPSAKEKTGTPVIATVVSTVANPVITTFQERRRDSNRNELFAFLAAIVVSATFMAV